MSWANEVRKLFGLSPIADPVAHCKHLYDKVLKEERITIGGRGTGTLYTKECCKCGAIKSFETGLK